MACINTLKIYFQKQKECYQELQSQAAGTRIGGFVSSFGDFSFCLPKPRV